MIESAKQPIYSSMDGSSSTNTMCSVRVDRMNGMVLRLRNPFSDGLCVPPLDWELSKSDLDVNYIAHVLKDVKKV